MTSLYRRASPSQARILRIVEGAVKNTIDAHGDRESRNFARSVAKRAAGTLTAQWPDVLAASSPSDQTAGDTMGSPRSLGAHLRKRQGSGGHGHSRSDENGGRLRCSRRPPLRRLQVEIGILARNARKAEQFDRLEALVDALRLIAKTGASE
jgi:hypothetical protein